MRLVLLFIFSVFTFGDVHAQIPTSGLIKDYKFTNGALTSDVNPLLQVGNTTLVPTGSSRINITDRNSETDKAITLNGDSFTAGGTNAGLVNTFAVSLWVKTTTNESPKRYILDQHQTTGVNPGGFSISLKDGKIYFRGQYNYNVNSTYTSSPVVEIISNTINDDQWHHVVCQVTSTSVTTIATGFTNYAINYQYSLYIDKLLVTTSNHGTNVGVPNGSSYSRRAINPLQQLHIGKSIDVLNLGYSDALDQMRYYETSLTGVDIEKLYLEDKPPVRYYVNSNATGSNNGTSWANAYTDINAPLSFATALDEIWVAAGTYKPNGTARTSSFTFYNGMKIYGGFNGSETQLSERNPKTNITILSGDINDNDNAIINATEATRQDNAYHVISVRGNTKDLFIDGFKITGGNANGPTLTTGAGALQYYHTRGGAIYVNTYTTGDSSSININNCILEANSGSDTGVASSYFPSGVLNQNYTLNFDSCIMRNNFSGTNSQILYAGANGYSWIANGTLKNCLFYNNSSTSGASCLYLSASNANSGNQNGINVDIINTTFASNTGVSGNVIKTVDGSNVRIKNSIIYNNGSLTPFTIGGSLGGPSLQNTISQGGQISGQNVDPLLNANFTLQATSPAINSGNNTLLPANTNFDLAGNNRIVNTTVDMGAYEYDAALNSTTFTTFKEFKVYPNPTSNEIFIDCMENLESVKLLSYDGKLLLETQNKHLSIQDLPTGIYLLVLESESGQIGNQKIIKN